jgi:hypothetical protein
MRSTRAARDRDDAHERLRHAGKPLRDVKLPTGRSTFVVENYDNTFNINGFAYPEAASRRIGPILSSQLNRSIQISLEDRASA